MVVVGGYMVGKGSLSYGPSGSGIGHPAKAIPGRWLSRRIAKFTNLK